MAIGAEVIGIGAGAGVTMVLGMSIGCLLNRVTRYIMQGWKDARGEAGQRHDYSEADFNIGRVHGWRGDLQGEMLGAVERWLYFALFLIGAEAVIAALLALKVASKWKSWTLAGEAGWPEMKAIRAEIGYVRFLLGTTANLLYALVGVGVAHGLTAWLVGTYRV